MNTKLFSPGLHKLIHHQEHLSKIEKRDIVAPIHVSVWPTNQCQLQCDYCCFGKTKRNDKQLNYVDFVSAVDFLQKHGTKAIEFSGGGEPLLWKKFEDAVNYVYEKNLNLSLVTNGLALRNISQKTLSKFNWIRVSIQSAYYAKNIDISHIPNGVRKSLSYIVSSENNSDEIERIYEFSEKYNIVTRIAPKRPSDIYFVDWVKREVKKYGYPLLFFDKESGVPDGCYFAWIRGAIDWSGMYLPCPSIELSPESAGEIPKDFAACHISKLEEWFTNNRPHNMGYNCSYCNCGKDINNYVHILLQKVEDVNFV